MVFVTPAKVGVPCAGATCTGLGEASLRWHLLLEALSGPDLDGLEDAVLELLSVGHTSGADALGGFRDVLNVYKEARKA